MKARITQAIEMRDAIASPEMATETSRFLLDILQDFVDNQPIGETGSCETVADPEVAVSVIELLHDCVNAGGDLSSGVSMIAKVHHLDRKESTKSNSELYLQYRACALLDAALSHIIRIPDVSGWSTWKHAR